MLLVAPACLALSRSIVSSHEHYSDTNDGGQGELRYPHSRVVGRLATIERWQWERCILFGSCADKNCHPAASNCPCSDEQNELLSDDNYAREEVSAVLLDMVTTVELFGDQRKGTSFVRERPNKKKKLCSSAGCKNLARPGKVVCAKHGAKDYRKLCSAVDCTSYARKGGLCMKHGANVKKCDILGCTNHRKKGGVCRRHGGEIFDRVPAPKRKREASDGDDEEEAYPKKAARILGESSGSNASWPLTNILTPGSNDCLFGSGGVTNKHPGNRKYRHLVTLKEETYRNANRLGGKGVVAMEVVDVWRNMDPPGRFLQQDKDSMLWSDVGDVKAKKKVTTAFIYRMRSESVTKASKGASVSGSKRSSEKYVPSPPSYPPPGYLRIASSTTEMQSVLI